MRSLLLIVFITTVFCCDAQDRRGTIRIGSGEVPSIIDLTNNKLIGKWHVVVSSDDPECITEIKWLKLLEEGTFVFKIDYEYAGGYWVQNDGLLSLDWRVTSTDSSIENTNLNNIIVKDSTFFSTIYHVENKVLKLGDNCILPGIDNCYLNACDISFVKY